MNDDAIVNQEMVLDAIWQAVDALGGTGAAGSIHWQAMMIYGAAISFPAIMMGLGMLAAQKRIVQTDPEQLWTREWADVCWFAVTP